MSSGKPSATAVKTLPFKKDLKKACDELQTHSSHLASFSLQWKGLEDHLSSIVLSIEDRLRELESGDALSAPAADSSSVPTPQSPEKGNTAPAAAAEGEEPEVHPRPKLKSLCVQMDGKGLLAFINDNRKDLLSIYKELNRAIRAAPDPANLILDAMDGFYPAKRSREDTYDGGLHANWRTCICLLERLHVISPEIKPSVRDRAKKLATEWEAKVTPDSQNNVEAMAFLQLLVSYGIVSDFEADDLLDLLVSIAKKKEAVGLCRNLGLYERMDDIVQKLSSKGKQLDAVKFVYAFELADKFPPVLLIKAYVKESKRIAQQIRTRGNNSAKSQNAAIARELDCVRAAIKIIEDYKLDSEYSPGSLQKRVAYLEQQRAEKRRSTASSALTDSKAQDQHLEANKRARLSAAIAMTAVADHPLQPLSHTQPQFPLTDRPPYMASTERQPQFPLTDRAPYMASTERQPQFPLTDRAPYMASAGPYDFTGNIHQYDQTASIYKGNLLDLGALRSPPRSLLYSDPRAGSALYDRSTTYGNFSQLGGLPPQYTSSLYP